MRLFLFIALVALCASSFADDEMVAATSVLGVRSTQNSPYKFSVMPVVGAAFWTGNRSSRVYNDFTLGVIGEMQLSPAFAIEVGGSYGRYHISYYGWAARPFDLYDMGAHLKWVALPDALVRPYLGVGMSALYYDGLLGPNGYKMSQWVGNLEPLLGADVSVSEQVSLGARAVYSIPVFNRPEVKSFLGPYGRQSQTFFNEAELMNDSHIKLVGTVKVTF